MMIAVSEFAMRRGITPRRVRALIASGKLTAQKVGNRWVLDDTALKPARPAVRPMSRRMAWAFADELDEPGTHASPLSSTETRRIRARAERLRQSDDPVVLLSAWLADRADHRALSAAPGVLNELRADRRVIASGISDDRSGLSSLSEFEGYVDADDIDDLAFDYLLVPGNRPNVLLHVVDRRPTRISAALLAVDLAERSSPRELTRAKALLGESL